MPSYESALFDPPAPLARVTLHNPQTDAALSDVMMLLDSGADVTLVPHEVMDRLGLVVIPDSGYELIGFDGSSSFAPVVQLELHFCRRTFRGQFLVIDQSWGIIGRNILNAVPLIFDGPHLMWEEQRSA